MKRGPNRFEPAGELSAVLDASINPPPSSNGASLLLEDDEHIQRLAEEQERSRKAFDAVLQKTSQQWRAVKDPEVLATALITVLDQIRGPALTHVGPDTVVDGSVASKKSASANKMTDDDDTLMDEYMDASNKPQAQRQKGLDEYADVGITNDIPKRALYIPLRLSQKERKTLRLVEAALNVSEYTDVVDVLSTSKMKTKQRMHAQIRDLCSILTGLAVAVDYSRGQQLVLDRDFAANEKFFLEAFEIARRHKVSNPEKSRETYGKLIHMLQDSGTEDIARLLEFSCVKPLITVASYLEERGGKELLHDALIHTATKEIMPDGKTRRVIQKEISQKEHAVAILAKRYRNGSSLGEDDIRRCLYSIGDNNAYLRCARDPCDIMVKYLHKYFKGSRPTDVSSSLGITSGNGGARLTHDHVRQFRYVFQSLALWREICHEMFKLWYLSESDLLDCKNRYHLRNTGQGLNRVQAAPKVSRAIYEILERVQRRVGRWIGSSVVHLGDYNVPNALTFIDKYAQVQRILGPLSTCIRRIGEVAAEDEDIERYVTETFGGVERARKMILRDFFRHGFDGSGANDWFSAGSCIDGRLTSAWNWCSEVEKKEYWALFLMTGFSGFDGDF